MNELIASAPVSHTTLEHVLGTGDLSKLSTQQRVEYYGHVCRSLGLNPLTRPFRFLSLNGQIQLYATRDCADQLRKVNGITLHVTDKKLDGELFIITVRAKDKSGREDEDIGAVTLGQLRGESRANALMKAMTKAKRRVTLSICGLGLPDESELDTMPGARVFDAEAEAPVAAAAPPEPPPVTNRGILWKDRVLEELALSQSEAGVDSIRRKIAKNYGAAKTAQPALADEIDAAERAARDRIRGVTGDDWDTKPGDDPVGELISEVEEMDIAALDTLATNAAWRAKTSYLFPLDAERVEDAISARKQELSA